METLTVWLTQTMQQHQTALVWAILALCAACAGALLYRVLESLYRGWKVRRRLRRAQQAERNAVRFLRRRGYRILAMQLEKTITVYVDGEAQTSKVRADFLVRRGPWRYVVEVKSGRQGDAGLPHVRRQMLEYKLVYRPHGVLLLDMERRSLQEIRFAYPGGRSRVLCGLLCAALVCGAVCLAVGRIV